MAYEQTGKQRSKKYSLYVALTALRDNSLIKEIYARHLKKGMKKKKAIVACMHKILRIVYGMLKNNEHFNPEKDRANSKKMLNNNQPEKKVINKLRRYQPVDSDAPISNRQYRKRKEQEKSQNEITSLNTGSDSHSSSEIT